MDLWYYSLIAGVIGLVFAVYLILKVMKEPRGTKEVDEISRAIEIGAIAFLMREYKTLIWFVAIVAIILGVALEPKGWVACAYLMGTVISVATGYIGMRVGTRANCRTVTAVLKSLNNGLRVAFMSGAVMGITVVSLGLIGLSLLYIIWNGQENDISNILVGFGFGASSIALFARVGGGIYTKGADVGSDLVGKIEAGIPEDDPRNPGVVADNVGDNVGDIAGMGADLFESYVGSIVATATIAIAANIAFVDYDSKLTLLPFIIAGVGILCSIAGTFFVRVGEQLQLKLLLAALRKGVYSASILVAGFSFLAIWIMDIDPVMMNGKYMEGLDIWVSIVSGLIAGVLIGMSIEYYTSDIYRPTRDIAKSSETGTGTLLIKGLATGMMSTIVPVALVVAAVLISYELAGLYGVSITAVGMLSTLGITLATDAYGPVADNAGGIAEQAHMPKEVRQKTDALDSLGNTTAATGKGFAIGSAAMTALGLTAAFGQTMNNEMQKVGGEWATWNIAKDISLETPELIVGVFIGTLMVFVFCALTMNAVGKAAIGVVEEVRRQWKTIPGLLEGKPGVKPDYAKCVDISTKSALRQMLLPGILAVTVPIIVGIVPFLGPAALGGLLIGSTASGFLMAVFMANSGGAWDNAKKHIEAGNLGGKGSQNHKAAVVGDTVGDPFKDTSGPSINILIKLMAMISLLFVPIFVDSATSWFD